MRQEIAVLLIFALPGPLLGDPTAQKYLATIQMAVDESPAVLERSQKRLVDEFRSTINLWSQLKNQHYEIRRLGNEIVISMVSDVDNQVPVEGALHEMIRRVNGVVPVHGRTFFHRAQFSPEQGPYILTEMDRSDPLEVKVIAIRVRSGRIGDILAELNSQIRRFGYFIRRECAERTVDWNIGGPGEAPKKLEDVINHLRLGLKDAGVDYKKSEDGTYVFTCSDSYSQIKGATPPALLQTAFFPVNEGVRPTVYLPLPPMD